MTRVVTMSSRRPIPLLGFGTYQLHGANGQKAIRSAVEIGLRHIDTATSYGNESDVGQAFADSGVPRDEMFLTSKLPLRCVGHERDTLLRSVELLRTDRLDLWLMHWPMEGSELVRTWESMIGLRDSGLVRDVGVSNFSIEQIDEITKATGVPPVVNQIRWNPFLFDAGLAEELRARNVLITAYTPLRRARLDDPVLVEIAEAVGATPAQVILRWHVQREWPVLFRSSRRDRIVQNVDIERITLDDKQMTRLDSRTGRYQFD